MRSWVIGLRFWSLSFPNTPMEGDVLATGSALHIFWVPRCAIWKGIDFPDIGIRNHIDFNNFGIRNGTNLQDFGMKYKFRYTF